MSVQVLQYGMKIVLKPGHTAVEAQAIADQMRLIVAEGEQKLIEARLHLEQLKQQAAIIAQNVSMSKEQKEIEARQNADEIGNFEVGIKAFEEEMQADKVYIALLEEV